MDTQLRRLALRAAAKLAFGTAFVTGCGGQAEDTDTVLTDNPLSDDAVFSDTVAADPTPETGLPDNPRGDQPPPQAPSLQPTPGVERPASAAPAQPEATPEPIADAAPDPSAPPVSGTDPNAQGSGLACLEEVQLAAVNAPTPPTAEELYCCLGYVGVVLAEPLPIEDLQARYQVLAADESFVNCCRAIINDSDLSGSHAGNYDCCSPEIYPEALDQNEIWQHGYCTPWGPSVPPNMDYFARGAV